MLTVRPQLAFMGWLKVPLVPLEYLLGPVLLQSLCLLQSVKDLSPPVGLLDRETLIVQIMGCAA